MATEGYEVEAHEIDAVWAALIGDRDGDDDMPWWIHLSSRLALLIETGRRIHDERARIAERWHRVDQDSFATIAARVGLTRARAQQLVERGREINAATKQNR